MRSSLTSLRLAEKTSVSVLGILLATGTLAAAPRLAHAQAAAPSASPAPSSGARAAAPAAAPSPSAKADDKEATDSTSSTAPAQPAAPPSSDAAAPKTEPVAPTKAAPADAANAKAQAEVAAPAQEAAPAAEAEAAPEVEKKEFAHAIYISGDFAFTRADVGGFSDSTGFDQTGANGIAYGFGAGYRANHFRVGGRFQANDTTEFNLWSVMAEVGYGFGFRPISPTIHLHGGYVFDTRIDRPVVARSLPNGNVLTPDVDLHGGRVGVEVVGNVWLSDTVRVGPFVGFDLLFLNRPKVAYPQSIYPTDDATRANPLYSGSGSGTGYIFNAGVRGTFDIGF